LRAFPATFGAEVIDPMHFDSERALDHVDGTMLEAERRFWDKHVESCGKCSDELTQWKTMASLFRGAHLMDAPQNALAYARQVFGRPQETLEFRPLLRQVIATLIFDSNAQPAFAGVREAAAGQAVVRQMILRAADFDVRIRVSSFDDRRDLLGQILPLGNGTLINDVRLHLRRGEERIGTAKANELGEFQFDEVPDDMLSLQIDLPRLTVISALVL
jgi:hypothetical protein